MRHAVVFFNDTATTEIYTLSLHDALPICGGAGDTGGRAADPPTPDPVDSPSHCDLVPSLRPAHRAVDDQQRSRSEEHTSELPSRQYLVCRLLLEKKKKDDSTNASSASSLY